VSLRHQFEGSPWTDRRQAYRDQSPITYAHRIRAPTLVMSNLSDFRVPVTQSYKLFRAIEDNAVEAKFIVYPGREHFPREPVRTMDVYRRWVDWVGRHFEE
jgi:dipeptidyl aminopeptidase/acylaminoacyl peptidase